MIDFRGALRFATAAATTALVKPSLSGSGPRSLVTCERSSTSQSPPNLRRSLKRISLPSSSAHTART